jgi:hypothetical protein
MLLLVVGQTNESWIEQHKRTAGRFTRQHYRKLMDRLAGTDLVTTGNILTEVSNLVAQIGEPKKSRLLATFAALLDVFVEIHLPGRLVMNDPMLLRLGLTDALILRLERGEQHILSVDGSLCLACSANGLPHTNLTPYFFELP